MKEQIVELYNDGFTMKEIGVLVGCERHKISRILKEYNVNTNCHELLKGKTFVNHEGDEYKVIDDYVKNGHGMCKVKFLETGYETKSYSSNVKRGNIKDYFKRNIYGVACKGKIICPKGSLKQISFHRWSAMVSRCYNDKDINYKAYGGRGVTICDNWLIFENFYNDLFKIEGFNKLKYINHEIELDKDTKGFNKEYSLENCVFISKKENNRYQRKNIKPFIAISPNGERHIFETQTDCAKSLNLIARTIGKCLSGQLKHHRGYSFKYLEENNEK